MTFRQIIMAAFLRTRQKPVLSLILGIVGWILLAGVTVLFFENV